MLDTETEEPGSSRPHAGPEAGARSGSGTGAEPATGAGSAGTGGRRPGRLAGYRPLIVLGVLAVVAGIVLAATVFRPGGTAAAKPIDQLVFINPDGSRSTLADHRGQPLVVNFFASWCVPCRAEMPDLQAVYESAGGKVQFLGIDSDIDEATWRSFVSQTSITYPTVFQADQSIWRALELSGMPSTVIISADGQVLNRYTGRISQETLREQIRQHLGVEV